MATTAAVTWIQLSAGLCAEPPVNGMSDAEGDAEGDGAACTKLLRLAEIRQHGAACEQPWVIKGTGVYNISDWVSNHPGGKIIMRAAGPSIEPYWDIFIVQSVITAIRQDQADSSSMDMEVEGYAFSGGGRRVVRVDISVDNGQTWSQARIEPDQTQGRKAWSWVLWKYCCERPINSSYVIVKAVEDAYNVQPDTHGPIFNFRGNLANAWHRMRFADQGAGEKE